MIEYNDAEEILEISLQLQRIGLKYESYKEEPTFGLSLIGISGSLQRMIQDHINKRRQEEGD